MRIFASRRLGKNPQKLYMAYTYSCFSCYIQLIQIRCLTNIANGDHKQTGSVLCAVPYMIEILSSSATGAVAALRRDSVELLEQICWAIGNIAGDCDEYRTILVSNGCLSAVLTFLESSVADIVRNKDTVPRFGAPVNDRPSTAAQTAAWALSNLSRGKISGQIFIDTGIMVLFQLYLTYVCLRFVFVLSIFTVCRQSAVFTGPYEQPHTWFWAGRRNLVVVYLSNGQRRRSGQRAVRAGDCAGELLFITAINVVCVLYTHFCGISVHP